MKSKKLEKLLFGRRPITDPWEEYEEIRMGRINDSPGTIESPNTALAQNDIMRTNAVRDSNKGIHQVMDAIGGFALNTGMSMMTKGLDSKISGLMEKPEMKYGGSVGNCGGPGQPPCDNQKSENFNEAYINLQNEMDAWPSAFKVKSRDSLSEGFRNYRWLDGQEGNLSDKGTRSGDTENTAKTDSFYKALLDMNKKTTQKMAYGGKGNGRMVEVEGKEVIDRPDSGIFEADGPSHKQGGIDTFLNNEDTVFSTQISDENGTMAEKKKKREKTMGRLEKLLKDNSTDTLLKNTEERTKEVADQEEKEDLMLQTFVGVMKGKQPNKEEKALGTSFLEAFLRPEGDQPFPINLTGTSDDFHSGDPSRDYRTTPLSVGKLESQGAEETKLKGAMIPDNTQASGNVMSNKEGFNLDMLKDLELPTAGDALGLYAQFKGMNAPMKNTLNMRAGDTPNINAFEDFGKDGLKTIQESKGYVDQNKESLESDLELSRRSQMKRNANSARGVNTKRALDLATSAGVNENRVKIGNQANNQMMQILAQEGQMENMQDKVVMGGEQSRDQRDRQDRDNFYSQMATDLATKFETMQGVGKNLNSIKGRGDNKDMIEQLVSVSENSNSMRELIKAFLKMQGGQVNVKDK